MRLDSYLVNLPPASAVYYTGITDSIGNLLILYRRPLSFLLEQSQLSLESLEGTIEDGLVLAPVLLQFLCQSHALVQLLLNLVVAVRHFLEAVDEAHGATVHRLVLVHSLGQRAKPVDSGLELLEPTGQIYQILVSDNACALGCSLRVSAAVEGLLFLPEENSDQELAQDQVGVLQALESFYPSFNVGAERKHQGIVLRRWKLTFFAGCLGERLNLYLDLLEGLQVDELQEHAVYLGQCLLTLGLSLDLLPQLNELVSDVRYGIPVARRILDGYPELLYDLVHRNVLGVDVGVGLISNFLPAVVNRRRGLNIVYLEVIAPSDGLVHRIQIQWVIGNWLPLMN